MIRCPTASRPFPAVARGLLALAWLALAWTMLPAAASAHSPDHAAMPVAAAERMGDAGAAHGPVGGDCCGSATYCTVLVLPGRQESGIRSPRAAVAIRIPADDANRSSASPERDPPVPRAQS